jgi:F-type H+-transporting ATPase subunit b
MAQVRAAAADAATAAAEIVLKDQAKTGLADRLIQASIGDIKRLAH